MRSAPTVATVKEGLAKIALKLSQLKIETHDISVRLAVILPPEDVHKRDLSNVTGHYSDGPHDRGRTPEPKRVIEEFLWDFQETSNLEIPTRAIIAIARELDNAFFDVRAIRNTIDAIADNSATRDEFREYLKTPDNR